MKSKFKYVAADIAECAIFVALMAVCTLFVQIPFYPVPLTFQTVISVLAGLLLGKKKGMVSMACYCLLGLIGAPIFSGFSGGVYCVLKPTFGYIVGFIFSAFVAGYIGGNGGIVRYIIAALAAFTVECIFGIFYFSVIWHFYLKMPDLWHYIVLYNLIYMPKDIVLCILAAILACKVLPLIRRRSRSTEKNLPQ